VKYHTDDVRITGMDEVIAPARLLEALPIDARASRLVFEARLAAADIMHGRNDRLLVIVGPCSIHDPDSAIAYAERLAGVAHELVRDLLIVMRVYFEKPRTTVGWKGLINDPGLDGSFDIDRGLRVARRLLLDVAALGLPAGTEYLDPITPQYLGDIVSWAAIGARTTESQVHRQLASGLSCPVGFKNSTEGAVQIAVDAVRSAAHPHIFLSVTKEGHSAIFSTAGNPDCHVILRGGNRGPNFDADAVAATVALLSAAGLPPHLMIDASHANSGKDHLKQPAATRDVAAQVAGGSRAIAGIMLESHLLAGRQELVPGTPLVYGQSITDACMSWETTEPLLRELATAVVARRRTN
jgi:3-deoxy-7-phosphoheptulonate synthase